MNPLVDKSNNLKYYLVLIVFSLPFACTLLYILNSSRNILFADEFSYISFIKKYYDGTLSFSDLWAPYNEMNLFLGKIIYILTAVFTGLNVQILMCLSCFVILGTSVLIYIYYKHTINIKNQYLLPVAFSPIVLLLFSVRQWESLLFGAQLPLFIMFFFLVMSILLMQKSLNGNVIDKYLFFSIVSSIIATFSFSSGLLVWILLVLQIVLSGLNKHILPKLFIYLASAIVVMTAYLYNTTAVSHITYFVNHLDRAIIFTLINVGNSIIGEISNKPIATMALIVGIILCILYIFAIFVFIKSDIAERKQLDFCILLIVFSLMSAILTTFGRLELAFENARVGFAYAASSRYSTAGIMGVIGVYIFYLYYLCKYYLLRVPAFSKFVSLFSILTTLILVGYSVSTIEESINSPYRRTYFENLINYANSNIDTLTEEQIKAFNANSPELVPEGLHFLKTYSLNVYH